MSDLTHVAIYKRESSQMAKLAKKAWRAMGYMAAKCNDGSYPELDNIFYRAQAGGDTNLRVLVAVR
jgi:hypothetical protein